MLLVFVLSLIVIFICLILRHKLGGQQLSKAEIKGMVGEKKVNNILNINGYRNFYDTLLKYRNFSSQFDHIVVFPNKVIVVIETKNKDGLIRGSLEEEKWVQFLGGKTYDFYSPIKQNEGHIKMLYRYMESYKLRGYRIYSLIVFTSDRIKLENVPPNVISFNELNSNLEMFNTGSLFKINWSRSFERMILKEDRSKNKKEVKRHKDFANRAKFYKKTV